MILGSQIKSTNTIYKTKPGRVAHISNPSTNKKQEDFCKFQASLLYMWATKQAWFLY